MVTDGAAVVHGSKGASGGDQRTAAGPADSPVPMPKMAPAAVATIKSTSPGPRCPSAFAHLFRDVTGQLLYPWLPEILLTSLMRDG
jgi:hypothetical protein